jgi:homoserine kinase
MDKVTVRIPASTSNLGPGFDCFGIALQIYNYITITRHRSRTQMAMVEEAAARFFELAKIKPFPFSVQISGDVPISRGLGSSVTVRLGVLVALNVLAATRLARHQLFELCAQLEGHPDNAAPACFGGFTLARSNSFQRFPVSKELRFVLLVPDFEVSTPNARKLLPASIPFDDAVANARNAAIIASAFASNNYKHLQGAFTDYLHQPYRTKLVPILPAVVKAAEDAGALGAFLSGSGSTIAALTLANVDKVATAMRNAAAPSDCQVIVVRADNSGAKVVQ